MSVNNNVFSPYICLFSNNISTVFNGLANLAYTLAIHPKRLLDLINLLLCLVLVLVFSVVLYVAIIDEK